MKCGVDTPGKRVFSFVSLAMVIILLFCAIAASGQAEPKGGILSAEDPAPDMLFMLLRIQADVQGSLNDLNKDVENAAQNLSATDMEGVAAVGVLSKLLETNSNLAEAFTFSKDGKVVAVKCKGCFVGGDGANISSRELLSMHTAENLSPSSREVIAHVLKTKIPDFTKEYQMVEGYNATALAYPVFSPQGEFIGGIVATIVPDKLMNAIVAPKLHFDIYNRSNITDFSFWVMHLDGLIAYDRDESQIGKYLFDDPLYQPFTSLLALGERMIAERAGHGSYSFQVTEGNKRVVTKEVYWTTCGLHGREWRLAVTRMIQ
ncbi:Cache domain protein [uncultured archaeon]|nr:Cache domain protein [uncultured archaeon]